MKRKNKDYLLGILDFTLIILSVILLILVTPLILGYFSNEVNDIQDVSDACLNIDLLDASECAVEITSRFYKYNIDNLGKDLDFQTLKEEGGVCSSWSDYYNEVGKNLGYNTENVVIHMFDNVYHEFNVWSNEDSYCVLDQTQVTCFGF